MSDCSIKDLEPILSAINGLKIDPSVLVALVYLGVIAIVIFVIKSFFSFFSESKTNTLLSECEQTLGACKDALKSLKN